MSILIFSECPGAHERHLIRKQGNLLFPEGQREISKEQLSEAQRLDHEALIGFISRFKQLIHDTVNLPPNSESEHILAIKEKLDLSYEESAGLADNQSEAMQAIEKLTAVIMAAIKKGAENDPLALHELEQEQRAREAHYELLKYPLVSDILNPDSPIMEHELIHSLLSAPEGEFTAALALFDNQQKQALTLQAQALIELTPDMPEQAMQRILKLSPAH